MSSTASCIVYLGPSLPLTEARALYGDADYRPPVRRGDLDQLAPGTVVGMIDGVFDQDLSVSPREVLNALRRRIHIIGSSSMGAMRASEVRGMTGVGRIYDMFKRGLIERDDEVALVFDPETYRAASEPMVNIRYAVERLTSSGTLSRGKGQRLLSAARRLHYRDRNYRRILRDAGIAHTRDSAVLLELLQSHNLKREDAKLLIEQLPEFRKRALEAPASSAQSPLYEISEHRDHLSERRSRARLPADAEVLVWEYGDAIAFRDLVRFLKLTGAFTTHARAAVARYLLQGNSLEIAMAQATESSTRQQALLEVMSQWGWYSAEETRVTLLDLGLGLQALFERVDEEVAARQHVLSAALGDSDEFLEALRCELVLNDLALKRNALRYGAFMYFLRRARADSVVTAEAERKHARAALCKLNGVLTWPALLARLAGLGISHEQAGAFADELALVRNAASFVVAPSRAALKRKKTAHERADTNRLLLKASPKAAGSQRFCLPMARAERIASRVARRIGITRVAMVGELDELAIQISQAYRPDSRWSTTAGSGKSETRSGARVGGIMEEAEKYSQDQFCRVDLHASFVALLRDGTRAVDPRDLDLPYDTRYDPQTALGWTRCFDLVNDEVCLVPAAMLTAQRLKADILYSERHGGKVFSSSGLASGFTLEEALLHATCEVVERHTLRMAELQLCNPGFAPPSSFEFVDLQSAPPSIRKLAKKLTAPGHQLRVLDITSDIAVPTFEARLFSLEDRPFVAPGYATHPNAEVAIYMAMLEAAQSKIGNVSGAREDLALAARSLGRHERPRPTRAVNELFWYGVDQREKAFSSLASFISRDALRDLKHVLQALRKAGVQRALAIDYSLPELAPVRAVRVLLPGLESANQFYTGPRARALAIQDMLPRGAHS
ncbi:MAG: hypothetical protein RL701_5706 [Pseudomonadota bacterium]|jgi:ribosomal protein S12 methylthiotransferase accessory factor